jgi:cysteine-rich repeat protein
VPGTGYLACELCVEPPLGCGNGVIAGAEECDDGNVRSCDECEPDCTLPTCGNGIVDCLVLETMLCGEVCDDGNTLPGDGCDSDCDAMCVPR